MSQDKIGMLEQIATDNSNLAAFKLQAALPPGTSVNEARQIIDATIEAAVALAAIEIARAAQAILSEIRTAPREIRTAARSATMEGPCSIK